MKMKIDGIRELFLEEILPVMENHAFRFLKSTDTFVYEDKEWRNDCILRFSELKDGKVSLRTEYFITSKKVSNMYKRATSEKDSLPTCGVTDIVWAYNHLGIPLDCEPWFDIDAAAIDSVVRKWIVEFESVGLVFFKEMNDYAKLEKVLDIFNTTDWPPLCMWSGERILHGICLYYINTRDKKKTLELFQLHRREVERINFSQLKNQFELLEQYIKSSPEIK